VDTAKIGRKSGKARVANLTAEKLTTAGRNAVQARWERYYKAHPENFAQKKRGESIQKKIDVRGTGCPRMPNRNVREILDLLGLHAFWARSSRRRAILGGGIGPVSLLLRCLAKFLGPLSCSGLQAQIAWARAPKSFCWAATIFGRVDIRVQVRLVNGWRRSGGARGGERTS
jgi:hypothetical protein